MSKILSMARKGHMKLSLRIDYLSSKKLAALFVFFWVVMLVVFGLARSAVWGPIAIVFVLLGVLLWTREWYFVMWPAGPVLERVRKTLDLLGLRYEGEVNRITTKKPRAVVKVRGLGEFALLSFEFDNNDKKIEGVLRKALLKVMRQS